MTGRYRARVGDREFSLDIEGGGAGPLRVTVEGREVTVEACQRDGLLVLRIGDTTVEAAVAREAGNGGRAGAYAVGIRGRLYPVVLRDPLEAPIAATGLKIDGPIDLRSVMPGRIAAVLVKEGETVAAGQGVVVVEAMKMENEISAPKEGRVASIQVRRGDTVEAGSVLLRIE